jgi:hypothetical protein
MLKFTFSISLIIILFSCSSNKNEGHNNDFDNINSRIKPPQINSNSIVIICHGEDAFAYHDHVCRGLRNCEASTEEVSVNEAVEMGRRPCGFCF